ncbi:spore maturation protein CgeB [Humidesulfovibrio mexicanus]|uniref:Spore maturation protein CgeB n=1 Tax=Humidesulfovibrio mexicanus TaxID=147047 RepID=A0A239ASZ9_9BACT|nr:glycosyltransferase [Humidesulfovibrio mexicanus]SNR98164.1 spore maturation protein CgeB [Humidesulfovibrio mexicanus]
MNRRQKRPPRLLLLTSAYFLLGELAAACSRQGVPHLLLDLGAKEMDARRFVETLRETVASFRPDAVLTVNHLGVDREGVLQSLAHDMRLPLVSWFVDNPEFILPVYPPPDAENALVLSWDADSLDAVRSLGFSKVAWLPLGTDPERFRPGRLGRPEWRAPVSFVGNSMLLKTSRRLAAARPGPALLAAFVPLSAEFAASGERNVRTFVAANRPELAPEMDALGVERRTAYETAVVWRATLDYRLGCVRRTLPFSPLVAGDPGWRELLPAAPGLRLHPEVNYYEELPGFYPQSDVNFNCTSVQMKGAVNQRVFDVPAAGAFLLTDHRAQLERMFEPGREIMLYESPEDASAQLERCLADADLRRRVAQAGRARVLAEHTYDHRLRTLLGLIEEHFPARRGAGA